MFDYNCTPIWLSDENYGDWLISSDGYFYADIHNANGVKIDKKVQEERLKGEKKLEKDVKLIYDIYSCLFDINEFPNGQPFLGFKDKNEETKFFDACDYVIKRMREIFGRDFSVFERDEKKITERGNLY